MPDSVFTANFPSLKKKKENQFINIMSPVMGKLFWHIQSVLHSNPHRPHPPLPPLWDQIFMVSWEYQRKKTRQNVENETPSPETLPLTRRFVSYVDGYPKDIFSHDLVHTGYRWMIWLIDKYNIWCQVIMSHKMKVPAIQNPLCYTSCYLYTWSASLWIQCF